nr:LOB domain-containing protein 37-like [Ipomoea batatas]
MQRHLYSQALLTLDTERRRSGQRHHLRCQVLWPRRPLVLHLRRPREPKALFDEWAALFQSLLYEAAGRTVNPVNGAVGLLGSGNWHVCQAAVETVLRGGELRPIPEFLGGVADGDEGSDCTAQKLSTLPDGSSKGLKVAADLDLSLTPGFQASHTPLPGKQRWPPRTLSMNSEESITTTTTCFEGGFGIGDQGGVEPKLLNLF